MLVKFLGVLDLVAAAWMILAQNHIVSIRIGLVVFAYLLLKGYIFRDNWISYIDFIVGIYALFLMFGTSSMLLSYLFAIYLVQKAIYSIFW